MQQALLCQPLTLLPLPAGCVQCRLHCHIQLNSVSDTASHPCWDLGGAMCSRPWAGVVHVQDHRASVQPESWQVSANCQTLPHLTLLCLVAACSSIGFENCRNLHLQLWVCLAQPCPAPWGGKYCAAVYIQPMLNLVCIDQSTTSLLLTVRCAAPAGLLHESFASICNAV